MIKAANLILATFSAVSFSAESVGGAESFPDDYLSASTGFTSVPTARALFKSPRWIGTTQAPAAIPMQAPARNRLALAVLGMPVDVGHGMLRNTTVQSDCLGHGQGQQSFSSCNGAQTYERVSSGRRFNLCDYDDDCWHSTAVAILALGNATQPSLFALGGQRASANFANTTFSAVARDWYKDYRSQADEDHDAPRPPSFQAFLHERFSGFGSLMNVTVPIAKVIDGGSTEGSLYITKKMVIDRGIDPGAPLLAVNVFNSFSDEHECKKHDKDPPCLLVSTAAQEQALKNILNDVAGASADNTRLHIGAIVIIAGGPLTAGRCDETPTARLIGELRRHGVVTFAAAGNDGNPTRVRFPACASSAIAVGSLTRDGGIAPSSNGAKTGLVSLYVDSDAVAIPIRGSRVAKTFAGSAEGCDYGPDCELRAPGDQYDAYLAGGTLLSTAVASGIFLDLRQRHPSASVDSVLNALHSKKLSSNPAFSEVDEPAATQILAAHGQR